MTTKEFADILDRGRIGLGWWTAASQLSLNEIRRMAAVSHSAMYSFDLDADEMMRVAEFLDRKRPFPLESKWVSHLEGSKTELFLNEELIRAYEEGKYPNADPSAIEAVRGVVARLIETRRDIAVALSPLVEQWAGLSLKPGAQQRDPRKRHCLRCDARWTSRTKEPKRCPSCFSDIWNDESKALVPVGE